MTIGLFQRSSSPLKPGYLNASLLEANILHYTNRQRRKKGIADCANSDRLGAVARAHSGEMARRRFFSHTSPVRANRTLEDRLRNHGISIVNTMFGENIGVDYFLKIASVPHYKKKIRGKTVYINARTHQQIPLQSYEEFAYRMVESLMHSRYHRENILNKVYTHIGLGAAQGRYKNMDAIFITQNFQGPV
jgi:uncharacterized protein YkwD